ncbi:MAG: hypothetical protein Q8S17_02155 [Humidesulfovibrio sp.]|nr:hypothetical protein [Humidesulfovibrio sp.]
MIFLHHPEVELSRLLLATKPEGCAGVNWMAPEHDGYTGPSPSAFPTLVVDVPAYTEDRPQFNEGGEFVGMEPVTVPAHEELLRMPASWEAVQSFVEWAEERARLRPAA